MSAIEDMLNEVNVESMLALIIDGVLCSSREYREATVRVRKAQKKFEKMIPKSATKAHMNLDDALVARMVVTSDLLVRWAYAVGLRAVPGGSRRARPLR